MTPQQTRSSLGTSILKILQQRDWQLVHLDADDSAWSAFTSQVKSYLFEERKELPYTQKIISRAVIGAYCEVLYRAATIDGTFQQQRAFIEIHCWIYNILRKKISNEDDVKDVAQETLEAIYKKLSDVTAPRGFLAWIGVFAHYQIKRYYNKKHLRRLRETFIQSDIDDDKGNNIELVLPDNESGYDALEIAEVEAELLNLIDECISHKARKQKTVFNAIVFKEKSVVEIAEEMGTTPNNIHLLFHRARKKLNSCPQLIAYLSEYIHNPERLYAKGRET